MRIAFLHYHLRTGGVTTVLRQQVESIQDTCDVLVLTGEPPESPIAADTVHIPGLGYSQVPVTPDKLKSTADAVVSAITDRWPEGCDVLHVHNPLLAKNVNLTAILKLIQDSGVRLFLQVHDFAEDGRPLAYSEAPYPAACHYGVINSRDYGILRSAGLQAQGLHKLPNAVRLLDRHEGIATRNAVLYPVRGLRRKNIGEAILLSLFFKGGEKLLITLPPNSPQDMASYEGWKRFAADKDLSVAFDTGLREDFGHLVSSSKFLVTTSISEGFGFSFLEPWTAGKMLWGRNLAGITDDFESNGIRLHHLYSRLCIPLEWIGEAAFFAKWKSRVRRVCTFFDYSLDDAEITTAFASVAEEGIIDFGLLDETSQKTVISRVSNSGIDAEKLIRLNPYLVSMQDASHDEALVQANRDAVLSCYSREACKNSLLKVYSDVAGTPLSHRIDKKALFSQFLDLEHFSLLKWGIHGEAVQQEDQIHQTPRP